MEVRESIRWMVKGYKKNYFDGLQLTKSRSMKRPIANELQKIIMNLLDYPNINK